jgi:hypothetical protein
LAFTIFSISSFQVIRQQLAGDCSHCSGNRAAVSYSLGFAGKAWGEELATIHLVKISPAEGENLGKTGESCIHYSPECRFHRPFTSFP